MQKQYSEKDVPVVAEMLNRAVPKKQIATSMGWQPWTLTRFLAVYFKEYVPPGNCKPYGNGRYFVYDDGRVWTCHKTQFLAGEIDQDGYLVYGSLRQFGLESKAHRLVLRLFDREPLQGEQTRHLNGTPNENTLANLVWGTGSENQRDRIKHGRHHWVK